MLKNVLVVALCVQFGRTFGKTTSQQSEDLNIDMVRKLSEVPHTAPKMSDAIPALPKVGSGLPKMEQDKHGMARKGPHFVDGNELQQRVSIHVQENGKLQQIHDASLHENRAGWGMVTNLLFGNTSTPNTEAPTPAPAAFMPNSCASYSCPAGSSAIAAQAEVGCPDMLSCTSICCDSKCSDFTCPAGWNKLNTKLEHACNDVPCTVQDALGCCEPIPFVHNFNGYDWFQINSEVWKGEGVYYTSLADAQAACLAAPGSDGREVKPVGNFLTTNEGHDFSNGILAFAEMPHGNGTCKNFISTERMEKCFDDRVFVLNKAMEGQPAGTTAFIGGSSTYLQGNFSVQAESVVCARAIE